MPFIVRNDSCEITLNKRTYPNTLKMPKIYNVVKIMLSLSKNFFNCCSLVIAQEPGVRSK